jgi:ketosteroid isomerase-like protein
MKILPLNKILLAGLGFGLILFSCNENDKLDIEKSAAAFDIKQGEASIKQSNQNFMKAFKAGDSVAVSNCYTTDAKAMVSNMPAIEGRPDIKHFISKAMNMGIREFDLNTLKIWGDSSILAEEGTYKFSDIAGKQLDRGKYIVLWKMEAGNWKMFRDIWTSDLPPAILPEKKSIPQK